MDVKLSLWEPFSHYKSSFDKLRMTGSLTIEGIYRGCQAELVEAFLVIITIHRLQIAIGGGKGRSVLYHTSFDKLRMTGSLTIGGIYSSVRLSLSKPFLVIIPTLRYPETSGSG